MLWKEKERSRIRAVQMNNLRSFLGIRMMDRVPNERIMELVREGLDERIDEGVHGLAMWKGWRRKGCL